MIKLLKQQNHRLSGVLTKFNISQRTATIWQKLFYALLLVVIMLMYSSIYFNSTFPVSEGWNINYAELVLHGKMPYTDFYYYLPPLNLAVDIIFWSLSFGSLFVYRAWWLLQRIVIFEMVFFLLCRYFKSSSAFLGCALGSILATASVYDLFGDYNQTVALLSIILIYCATGFAKTELIKKKCKYMVYAGCIIALLFLNKQTIFLSTILVYFGILCIVSVLTKDKYFFRYLLSASIGFFAVIIPVVIFMAYNGMLVPFVEQVFLNTGGKGDLSVIVFEKLFSKLFLIVPWMLCGLLLLAVKTSNKNEISFSNGRYVFVIFLIALTTICFNAVQDITNGIQITWEFQAIIFVGAIPLIVVTVMRLMHMGPSRLYTNNAIFLSTIFFSAFTLIVGYLKDSSLAREIFYANKNDIFIPSDKTYVMKTLNNSSDVFELVTNTFYFLVFCFILAQLLMYITKYKNSAAESDNRQILWITCGAFAPLYASLMASGGEIGFHATMIAIPFILCKAFSLVLKDKLLETAMRSATLVLCTVLCFICISQKFVAPYTWWGSTESAPKSEKIYSTDIPALNGFTFTETAKNDFESITRLILENTNEDDVVYGFPYLKIFNVLTERYQYDTFVPVMFYDVVDDKYVQHENELLKENLPDILLIQNIPNCMDAHESIFRNGEPLVQRQTLAYFESVIPKKYQHLGTFGDISVYKLVK